MIGHISTLTFVFAVSAMQHLLHYNFLSPGTARQYCSQETLSAADSLMRNITQMCLLPSIFTVYVISAQKALLAYFYFTHSRYSGRENEFRIR